MANLFPIMLNLAGKDCLVIGGGEVATRKVEDLLGSGACIKVIAPSASRQIENWATKGLIKYECRQFNISDVDGMILVISATNDDMINEQVALRCRQLRIMVNVVDDPPHCDFFVPAVVRRGSLIITVSTEGKSPVLAKLIREELQQRYGEEYLQLVEILGEARKLIKDSIPDIEKRKKIFTELAASQLLEIIRNQGAEEAREWMLNVYCSWGTEPPDSTARD